VTSTLKVAVGLALALIAAPALAEERITNFASDIRVQRNGALDVVETISLVAENMQIERGIQRDFPTRYPGRLGGHVQVGFDVLGVERDGHPEPYRLMEMRNGTRVRIGDAAKLLPTGPHVYRIHYRTTRQLGFYRDFDELYWNVTGTGWTFPIDRAEARISLPEAVPFGKRAVYTGAQGSTARNAAVTAERPGQIVFQTTAPLDPFAGLTVAVAWRKGVVTPPGVLTRAWWLLQESGPMLIALALLIAVLTYSIRLVRRAWHNPDPRPIVPLFAPPAGFSAAALRYVWRMGFDNRTFATALVDSAVRGALRIVETSTGRKPDRSVEKQDPDGASLPAPEMAMVKALFGPRKSVALKQGNHKIIGAAQLALSEGLDEAFGKDRYFTDAGRDALHPWALLFGPLFFMAWLLAFLSPGAWMSSVFGLPALALFCAYGMRRLSRYRARLPEGHRGRYLLSLIPSALLLTTLIPACFAVLLMGIVSGNPWPLIPPVLAFPALLIAWNRLRAPTASSWPIRAEIEGFRQYLSVAEEDRLEKLNPPEKTVALFERYLPYAMALGVENRWARRFDGILATAAADDPNPDRPWYSSPNAIASNPGALASALGSSFTTTIASAATAPGSSGGGSSGSSGSSGGSSGGGSSGGGGGGGGGSGW